MTNRTPIGNLGRAAFIDKLTSKFNSTIIAGIGDDCAVVERGDTLELISKVLLLEGIDFNLSYTPLEHLGLKLTTAAVSNILAMNGVPKYLMIGIALSTRFSVEEAEALYRGVERGCEIYGLELIGGDTSASITGLTLSATCIGEAEKQRMVLRSGAGEEELIVATGSLGGAYMGLQLLERERRAGGGDEAARAIFSSHKEILNRQLQPIARQDIVDLLLEMDIVPTSMIDITSGLSSAVLNICKSSDVGARLHLNKIPVNNSVKQMAEELNSDPIVAILNGGEDYELLFTLPTSDFDKIKGLSEVNIIGFTTSKEMGAALVTPDNEAIYLQSQEFTAQIDQED